MSKHCDKCPQGQVLKLLYLSKTQKYSSNNDISPSIWVLMCVQCSFLYWNINSRREIRAPGVKSDGWTGVKKTKPKCWKIRQSQISPGSQTRLFNEESILTSCKLLRAVLSTSPAPLVQLVKPATEVQIKWVGTIQSCVMMAVEPKHKHLVITKCLGMLTSGNTGGNPYMTGLLHIFITDNWLWKHLSFLWSPAFMLVILCCVFVCWPWIQAAMNTSSVRITAFTCVETVSEMLIQELRLSVAAAHLHLKSLHFADICIWVMVAHSISNNVQFWFAHQLFWLLWS